MPRITPLPEDQWTPEQRELLAPMQNNKGVGEIARNLFTTLVRHPKLFKRWNVFANHILFKSSLDPVLRELAILRVAWLTQADYEWGQHVLIGRRSGLSDDAIRRVREGAHADGWNDAEQAVLTAVDQLHEYAEIDAACWASLRLHFGDNEIFDLIFTAGNYRLLAGFIKSIEIQRDASVPGLEQP